MQEYQRTRDEQLAQATGELKTQHDEDRQRYRDYIARIEDQLK